MKITKLSILFWAVLPLLFLSCQTQKTEWIDKMDLSTVVQYWGVATANKTIIDNPLTIHGKKFERGFGTHAPSEFYINLYAKAERFKAFVGVDDEVDKWAKPGTGTVIFKVYGDDSLLYDSKLMTYKDPAKSIDINIKNFKILRLSVEDNGDNTHWDHGDWAMAQITYKEKKPVPLYTIQKVEPYILTPEASDTPRINGPDIYGASKGAPFLYKVPVSGKTPITYEALHLPDGLSLDSKTGIITGKCNANGTYKVSLLAKNTLGRSTKEFTIVIGNTIALTPPMGWNSWNVFGATVDEKMIRDNIDAIVSTGLINHGWTYVNIDDNWMGERDKNGVLQPNSKFKDIKALADYAHSKGLKLGIYSSPGPKTCAGFNASYGYEELDAKTWASWGIDYLKYDWCSYEDIAKDTSRVEKMKPFIKMHKALAATGRDIVYSITTVAGSGLGKVWEWGKEAGANSWRINFDISDAWGPVNYIGFGKNIYAPYNVPGHYNDYDMFVIGYTGIPFTNDIHPTRLNPNEQYTHITLWSMLATPLLIGCDLTKANKFTLNLLSNDEVLAINQDRLGLQGIAVVVRGQTQIWKKPLFDKSTAVAIFNQSFQTEEIIVHPSDIGLTKFGSIRNLWIQKNVEIQNDMIKISVPPHGCVFYKIN